MDSNAFLAPVQHQQFGSSSQDQLQASHLLPGPSDHRGSAGSVDGDDDLKRFLLEDFGGVVDGVVSSESDWGLDELLGTFLTSEAASLQQQQQYRPLRPQAAVAAPWDLQYVPPYPTAAVVGSVGNEKIPAVVVAAGAKQCRSVCTDAVLMDWWQKVEGIHTEDEAKAFWMQKGTGGGGAGDSCQQQQQLLLHPVGADVFWTGPKVNLPEVLLEYLWPMSGDGGHSRQEGAKGVSGGPPSCRKLHFIGPAELRMFGRQAMESTGGSKQRRTRQILPGVVAAADQRRQQQRPARGSGRVTEEGSEKAQEVFDSFGACDLYMIDRYSYSPKDRQQTVDKVMIAEALESVNKEDFDIWTKENVKTKGKFDTQEWGSGIFELGSSKSSRGVSYVRLRWRAWWPALYTVNAPKGRKPKKEAAPRAAFANSKLATTSSPTQNPGFNRSECSHEPSAARGGGSYSSPSAAGCRQKRQQLQQDGLAAVPLHTRPTNSAEDTPLLSAVVAAAAEAFLPLLLPAAPIDQVPIQYHHHHYPNAQQSEQQYYQYQYQQHQIQYQHHQSYSEQAAAAAMAPMTPRVSAVNLCGPAPGDGSSALPAPPAELCNGDGVVGPTAGWPSATHWQLPAGLVPDDPVGQQQQQQQQQYQQQQQPHGYVAGGAAGGELFFSDSDSSCTQIYACYGGQQQYGSTACIIQPPAAPRGFSEAGWNAGFTAPAAAAATAFFPPAMAGAAAATGATPVGPGILAVATDASPGTSLQQVRQAAVNGCSGGQFIAGICVMEEGIAGGGLAPGGPEVGIPGEVDLRMVTPGTAAAAGGCGGGVVTWTSQHQQQQQQQQWLQEQQQCGSMAVEVAIGLPVWVPEPQPAATTASAAAAAAGAAAAATARPGYPCDDDQMELHRDKRTAGEAAAAAIGAAVMLEMQGTGNGSGNADVVAVEARTAATVAVVTTIPAAPSASMLMVTARPLSAKAQQLAKFICKYLKAEPCDMIESDLRDIVQSLGTVKDMLLLRDFHDKGYGLFNMILNVAVDLGTGKGRDAGGGGGGGEDGSGSNSNSSGNGSGSTSSSSGCGNSDVLEERVILAFEAIIQRLSMEDAELNPEFARHKLLTQQDGVSLDTPNHTCARYSLLKVQRWLLERCDAAMLVISTKDGWLPLHTACRGSNLAAAVAYLRRARDLGMFDPGIGVPSGVTNVILADLTPFNKYYRKHRARDVLERAIQEVWPDGDAPAVFEDVTDTESLKLGMERMQWELTGLKLNSRVTAATVAGCSTAAREGIC